MLTLVEVLVLTLLLLFVFVLVLFTVELLVAVLVDVLLLLLFTVEVLVEVLFVFTVVVSWATPVPNIITKSVANANFLPYFIAYPLFFYCFDMLPFIFILKFESKLRFYHTYLVSLPLL